MSYTVFTDFHHASLLNSLILLFEKRLGGQLFRPIGMEWAEQGYWKVYDHPATQAQFLGIGAATPDGSPPLNEVTGAMSQHVPINGVYYCKDIETDQTNKAITLSAFLTLPFDFVIASLPQHIRPFKKLCELHPNHPKLIYQIGNQWNIAAEDACFINGVMASAQVVHNYPLPTIQYHQEFDLSIFHFGKPSDTSTRISSFVNCFSEASIFQLDWAIFQSVEKAMPTWEFSSYGGQCRDGACHGVQQLADIMRDSRFIWHTKHGGDGYGHVLHNAAAVGRPMIVRKSQYFGKLGESLLIPDGTCLNIDGLSVNEIMNKIQFFSEEDRYQKMCSQVYANFQKVVNFDAEFLQLRDWLAQLL